MMRGRQKSGCRRMRRGSRIDEARANVVIIYNFCHDEERRQLEQKTNKNIRIQIRTDPIKTEVWKQSIQLLYES